jgi:hypothetical protein
VPYDLSRVRGSLDHIQSNREILYCKLNVPPHLFSIKGDTLAEGPLGQNILDPSLFIGAISRSCARSSLAEDILISVIRLMCRIGCLVRL